MDPYRILEVSPAAPDAELRAAYRRAVQRHHPDHGGTAEAFEAVQEAWARIRRVRTAGGAHTASRPADPHLESRLEAMERELREAREAAANAAAQAHARADAERSGPERPSDEELGYVRTEDTFGKILSDAREELLGSLEQKPVTERAADLLDEVAAALRGERPKRPS